CSEVVVDTLTGESKLLRADILYDAGRPINPAVDLGQIEGGFIQGMGWLTTEELWWDDAGALKTHAPSTYKIPSISDCPEQLNIQFFDNGNTENNIYQSKAMGEPPLPLAISVFLAIRDRSEERRVGKERRSRRLPRKSTENNEKTKRNEK